VWGGANWTPAPSANGTDTCASPTRDAVMTPRSSTRHADQGFRVAHLGPSGQCRSRRRGFTVRRTLAHDGRGSRLGRGACIIWHSPLAGRHGHVRPGRSRARHSPDPRTSARQYCDPRSAHGCALTGDTFYPGRAVRPRHGRVRARHRATRSVCAYPSGDPFPRRTRRTEPNAIPRLSSRERGDAGVRDVVLASFLENLEPDEPSQRAIVDALPRALADARERMEGGHP